MPAASSRAEYTVTACPTGPGRGAPSPPAPAAWAVCTRSWVEPLTSSPTTTTGTAASAPARAGVAHTALPV